MTIVVVAVCSSLLFLSDCAEKVLETTYHGLIKENETFVELMPQLRVAEGKICSFHIRNTHKGDIPFQVRDTYIFLCVDKYYRPVSVSNGTTRQQRLCLLLCPSMGGL